MFGIFLFCLDFELLEKTKKDLVSKHSQKPFFLHFFNSPRCNENLKNPEHPFADTVKYETCAKFKLELIK